MTVETKIKTRTKINTKLKPPVDYRVIYINDEVTTMEFVVESLMTVFGYSEDAAATATENIHIDGSATVAVLPYELAEQKGVEVTLLARKAGFPLQVKIEPEQ
jgi:ATP-dependent Clp protease adaptor protein ClpS